MREEMFQWQELQTRQVLGEGILSSNAERKSNPKRDLDQMAALQPVLMFSRLLWITAKEFTSINRPVCFLTMQSNWWVLQNQQQSWVKIRLTIYNCKCYNCNLHFFIFNLDLTNLCSLPSSFSSAGASMKTSSIGKFELASTSFFRP